MKNTHKTKTKYNNNVIFFNKVVAEKNKKQKTKKTQGEMYTGNVYSFPATISDKPSPP